MNVSNRDRIIAIQRNLKSAMTLVGMLPDSFATTKANIQHELDHTAQLLAGVVKAHKITEEFHAQLLQQLGATNQVQAGEIIGELQATQRTKIDPSWSLHDRVEFALRDAGFGLDEAAFVAELAKAYEETKDDGLHDRVLTIMQANGIPEAKHIAEGGALVLALTKILLTVRRRMMFIQQPGEPMWNPTGHKWVPDWRYESQLVEFGLFATPITVAEHPTDTKRRCDINE